MSENNLNTLNKHLFALLESLSNDKSTEKERKLNIENARATTSIAKQIIDSAKVQLQAEQMYKGLSTESKPTMFSIEHDKA